MFGYSSLFGHLYLSGASYVRDLRTEPQQDTCWKGIGLRAQNLGTTPNSIVNRSCWVTTRYAFKESTHTCTIDKHNLIKGGVLLNPIFAYASSKLW